VIVIRWHGGGGGRITVDLTRISTRADGDGVDPLPLPLAAMCCDVM
jgi:hypothetical protein